MAGNTGSDGSIIIDTRLDTSGFKRESAKLNTAVTSLSRQVNNLGKSLQATMSKGANPAAIERFKVKAAETEQQLQSLRERLMAFGETEIKTDKYNELCAEIKKTEEALQRLYDRQEKLKAMGADQASTQWQTLQKDIDETTSRLEFYKRGLSEAQEFLREMQTPEAQAEAHAGGPDAWADYKAGLENAEQEVKENRAEVEKLEAALAKLLEKQEQMKAKGADLGSKQWQSLQYDIEKTREKLDQLTASKEQMENTGTDTVQGNNSEDYQRMTGEIEQLENKLAELNQQSEGTRSSFSGFASVLSGVASVIGEVASAATKAAVQLDSMIGKGVITGLKQVYSCAWKATTALLALHSSNKKATSGFKMGFMTILKYGLGIRSTYMLFRKLRAAIKESLGTMAKIDAPTNKAISSMKSALDQLKNSFGSAFQPIVTAVAPYITQLLTMLSGAMTKIAEFFAMLTGQKYILKATAQQTDYAKSLDKTTKSAKETKKQLAGFDELNVLTDSSSDNSKTDNAAGQFEKVPITGISDFLQRIKDAFLNGDYEEIGRIVAEKINGIFQKINDLISWENIGDEITKWVNVICGVINGLIDGIDWTLIGQTFASGINTIINTLYLLLEGINWTALGTGIGTGLSAMLNGVDWQMFGSTLAQLMTLKLRLLAAAVEAFDWTSLGANLALGLNTFVSVLTGVIEGINWTGLTASFVAGLNSLVSNIDWAGIGNLIGTWMGTVLAVLGTAITTFDWVSLGNGLATGINTLATKLHAAILAFPWAQAALNMVSGLNSLITGINWAELGATFGAFCNGVLDFILTTVTEFDWASVGTSLAAFVDTAFETIEWDKISESISTTIKGLLEAAKSCIEGLDVTVIKDALYQYYSGIDWAGIAESLFSFLGEALGTLGSFIGGLISDAFTNIKEYFDDKIQACGGDIVAGIFEGISAALVGIVTWINEHIFKPFIEGFKKVFKIASPSKVMEELGGYIVEGLKNGISGVWDAIKQFFIDAWNNIKKVFTDGKVGEWFKENVWDKITAVFETVGEWFKTTAENMWNGITSFFTELGEGISTWFTENVWNKITAAFDSAGEWFKTAAENMWNGITSFFTELGDGITTWFTENVWNKITAAFSNVKDWFSTTAGNMWDGVTSFFTNLGDGIGTWFTENVWNKITGAFSGAKEWFNTTAGNMWSGITSFFTNLGDGIGSWFTENVWDKITGVFSGVTDWFKTMAGNIWSGLTTGLSEKVESVKEEVSGFFSNVWSGVLDFFGIHSPSTLAQGAAENVLEGFSQGAEGKQESAGQRLKSVFSGIYDAAKGVWDSVTGWLAKLFGWGADEDKESKNAEKQASDAAGKVASGVETAFSNVETSISEPIEKGTESGITAFTNLKTSGETTAKDITTAFNTMKTDITSTITELLSSIKTTITTELTSISTKVTTTITSMKTKIEQSMKSISSTISTNASNMKKTINSEFSTMQNKITSTMNQACNTAKQKYQSLSETIQNESQSMESETSSAFDNMKSTIESNSQSMESEATSAFDSMESAIASDSQSMESEATSAFDSISSTIQSASQSANQSVSSYFDSIYRSITDNLSNAVSSAKGLDWYGIGSNICNGISQGINNGWSWLHDLVWNLAQSLLKAAKSALGINSPSKLFKEQVGEMLGLGVAEGMEDSQPTILDSVTNVTDAIADEMQDADAIANLRLNGENLINGLDGVLTTFSDRVSNTFSDLVDRISAIADTVAFRMPAAVSGGAIPYNVSANAGSGAEGLTDALIASNEDLSNVVIQSVTNATAAIVQAIETYSGSTQKIDKRSFTDAIIEEINRRTRMAGKSPLLI